MNGLQLIFRKVADVKREQELAERRKNDPVPDLAQDHLVRKIFSKFRKPSDSGVPQVASRPGSSLTHPQGTGSQDLEKGEMPQTLQTHETEKPVPAVSSQPPSRTSTGGSRGSKWAALTNRASHNSTEAPPSHHATETARQNHQRSELMDNEVIDKQTSDRDDQNLGAVRRTELVCKKSEHIHVVKDIRPPTTGKTWPRVATGGSSSRPETIEESNEPQDNDGGQGGQPRERRVPQIAVDGEGGRQSDSSKVVIQPKSINSADYQQIIASLIDMRIDLKLEIQKLSNKVSKIDDHIADIVRKLSAITVRPEDNGSLTASSAAPDNKPTKVSVISNKNNDFFDESEENRLLEETNAFKCKSESSKQREGRPGQEKIGHRSASRTIPQSVPIRTINASSNRKSDSSNRQPKHVSDASNAETDEMRAMLENEIAEQDVDNTDDDQDLTSKL